MDGDGSLKRIENREAEKELASLCRGDLNYYKWIIFMLLIKSKV